jgi:hypothetical protein
MIGADCNIGRGVQLGPYVVIGGARFWASTRRRCSIAWDVLVHIWN